MKENIVLKNYMLKKDWQGTYEDIPCYGCKWLYINEKIICANKKEGESFTLCSDYKDIHLRFLPKRTLDLLTRIKNYCNEHENCRATCKLWEHKYCEPERGFCLPYHWKFSEIQRLIWEGEEDE